MGDGQQRAVTLQLALNFCSSHPQNRTSIHTAGGVCTDKPPVFFESIKLSSGLLDRGFCLVAMDLGLFSLLCLRGKHNLCLLEEYSVAK